ncbi:MAG: manganese efflux pump MntP family protein [Firmicutes bacterium]|nr:manganese efflux pump MntP family protein [Bacillota bacterium]
MQLWEIFIIGVGLSMDAFAIAICRGLKNGTLNFNDAVITALFFGGFQALMPAIGYLIGDTFAKYITSFDHWVAFILLALIGVNMIKEAFEKDEKSEKISSGIVNLLMLSVATSIDALAVGITFALGSVDIVPAIAVIGCTTFIISFLGVGLGSILGCKFKRGAEITGGLILIIMGLKILIEHLFFQ